MKNILFVGNSLVNAKAIELIRQSDKDVAITLISSDDFLPYSRQSLLNFLGKVGKEKQVYFKPDGFYKDEKVRVIAGQAINRINFKRNQVTLENKEQLSYDALVLADLAPPRFAEIKGIQKQGVFHAVRLKDVREVINQVLFAQTVVCQLSNLQGFLTLCALSQYSKEIIVTCSQDTLLGGLLDAECSSMLKQFLEMKGMRLMTGTSVEEILGDSDLKAVRLTSGKVLSTEMVMFDDLRCDTRILKETGLENTTESENSHRSNFPNVFWADAIQKAYRNPNENHYEILDETLLGQAQRLVSEILNVSPTLKAPEFVLRFAFKDLRGCWFGSAFANPDLQEHSQYDPQNNVYKKFFLNQGRLAGGFVLGEETLFDKCIALYQNQTVIQGIEEELLGGFGDEKSLAGAEQRG